MNTKRLLIVTQSVDLDDPVLGFFHKWIEEFAKHADIHVICLKEGRHALPGNVVVHSLGKEQGVSRITYVRRFYSYIWTLRREYDAVFVHMNPEYVLLGGLLWRLWRKRTVLERNHKIGVWSTPIACALVNTVDYTSPSAYVARYRNAKKSPIGIDTVTFSPGGGAIMPRSVLFLGRFDSVKRPDVFLDSLKLLDKQGFKVTADIYGDPTPGREAYAEEIRKKYRSLSNVSFHRSVPNSQTPPLYRSHEIYVNLTPSGSLDKTIGEAMACGSIVVCANDAVRDVMPAKLMAGDTAESAAHAIRAALEMADAERSALAEKCRAWIEREHSLTLLGTWLLRELSV